MPTASTRHDTPSTSRAAVFRRVAGLAAATSALVVLIVLLGDVRRASNVLTQSRQKAAAAQARLNSSSNPAAAIEFLRQQSDAQTGIPFEYRPLQSAANRKANSTGILVAHSPRVRRVFLGEGRGVILFHGDSFSGHWVSEAEFRRLEAARSAAGVDRDAGEN